MLPPTLTVTPALATQGPSIESGKPSPLRLLKINNENLLATEVLLLDSEFVPIPNWNGTSSETPFAYKHRAAPRLNPQ